ncbi:MAG: thioredoxin [Prevotella sp.]|nr:thioredoxin [Alistipes senegalensis]MCM1357251.1 thioredoxin [Prevotella sp.]MCM1472876.1 thioredoxin [Muribaculaceae bacterium]
MEITITKENFDDEVRNYKGTVLLDFWADWCGPCMMLSPAISKIATELAGKVKVGKVNVDEQPELSAAFRVESIPLLVVVKDGVIQKQSVGVIPENQILEMLK